MRKITILFAFLGFYCTILPIFGQETLLLDSVNRFQLDWQEQILQQVDIDELGDEAYQELLEDLSEMVLWSDTTTHTLFPHTFRHQLIIGSNSTLNTRAGYRNPDADRRAQSKAYLGDSWHHSVRYRLMDGRHWKAGFSLEKDAGEPWRHSLPTFDSWHGYLSYQSSPSAQSKGIAKYLNQAVVGHYRMRMGCGLLLNQGFSLGKPFMIQQFQQRSNTISPYASNAEADYMQGAALRFSFGRHFSLLPYVSALQLDGTLDDGILTSIKADGMHRTEKEASKRNAAWQSIFGARAGWRGEWYDIGLHLMTTHLQYDYIRALTYYNTGYFRGHQLTQFSGDYQLRALGFTLQGELAADAQGGLASICTIRHPAGRFWAASLTHRFFSSHYQQLHASTLSESSAMQGEQGITFNLNGSFARNWQLQLMADYFRFYQPQYGIRDESSQGAEGLARATYSHRLTTFSMGYRVKYKGDCIRHSFDSYFTFSPLSNIVLRTQFKGRIYSQRNNNPTYGYALGQSATWTGEIISPKHPFSINAQAAYFNTDGYDTRLYLTERTVLYGFGLPMFYGQGLRYSLTGNLQLSSRIILELKWALTNYADRNTIGSGLQEIKGNTQQDLWLQLRVKL